MCYDYLQIIILLYRCIFVCKTCCSAKTVLLQNGAFSEQTNNIDWLVYT